MPSPTAKLINSLISCQYDQPDRHRLMGVKSFSDWYFRVARRDMIQWRMRQLKKKYGSIVKYYEGNYRRYSFIHFHPNVYHMKIMQLTARCSRCRDVLNQFDAWSYGGLCENCYAYLNHPTHYCDWCYWRAFFFIYLKLNIFIYLLVYIIYINILTRNLRIIKLKQYEATWFINLLNLSINYNICN